MRHKQSLLGTFTNICGGGSKNKFHINFFCYVKDKCSEHQIYKRDKSGLTSGQSIKCLSKFNEPVL